tara:strand:- start:393 stop:608 length:216 start_codon:yes stop_codon:yes gene_type:complete
MMFGGGSMSMKECEFHHLSAKNAGGGELQSSLKNEMFSFSNTLVPIDLSISNNAFCSPSKVSAQTESGVAD